MLTRKHLRTERRTTLALEPIFWRAIEALADGKGAVSWITDHLADKPEDVGAASWIRQQALLGYLPNDFDKKQGASNGRTW